MGLTFWENVYANQIRKARRQAKDPAGAHRRLSNHGVTDTSTMILAEHEAPPGAEQLIASEMAALRARGTGVVRKHAGRSWIVLIAVLFLCGDLLYKSIRDIIPRVQDGKPWVSSLLGTLVLVVVMGLVFFAGSNYADGSVRLMNRLCADWAERLGGKSGSDTLDEIIAWLEARWAWFLPPNMCENDVLWAVGTRRGAPVLAVLEHFTGTVMLELLSSAAAGIRNRRVLDGKHARTNVFIHGARFRDAAHRERVRKTLALMYGGAVQGPNGVYIYGPLTFNPLLPDKGFISEIWVDVVDQVIDPDFHGSERAAKLLHDELVIYGLAAPADRPHA